MTRRLKILRLKIDNTELCFKDTIHGEKGFVILSASTKSKIHDYYIIDSVLKKFYIIRILSLFFFIRTLFLQRLRLHIIFVFNF